VKGLWAISLMPPSTSSLAHGSFCPGLVLRLFTRPLEHAALLAVAALSVSPVGTALGVLVTT